LCSDDDEVEADPALSAIGDSLLERIHNFDNIIAITARESRHIAGSAIKHYRKLWPGNHTEESPKDKEDEPEPVKACEKTSQP
jgi:hypothetical protein